MIQADNNKYHTILTVLLILAICLNHCSNHKLGLLWLKSAPVQSIGAASGSIPLFPGETVNLQVIVYDVTEGLSLIRDVTEGLSLSVQVVSGTALLGSVPLHCHRTI